MQPHARSYRIAIFLTALVTFTGAASARAQSIEDARGLWFDADFEASRDAFLAVLASPSLTTADALDAHRYLAPLYLVLHDAENARRHADAAVALDLTVTLPEGAPNAAVDLFRMARRRLGDRAAALTVEPGAPLRHGVRGLVVARFDPAPEALATMIRLQCGDQEVEGLLPSVSLDVVPQQDDVHCTATVHTSAGATLFTQHRELEVTGRPAALAGTSLGTQPEAGHDTGRRTRRWVIVSTVLALAVAGTVTGVVVHNRNNGDVGFNGTTVVGW